MRHVREVLRQKLSLGRTHRETARSVGISSGAVAGAATRAKHVGLTWEILDALRDVELDELPGVNYISPSTTTTLPHRVGPRVDSSRRGSSLLCVKGQRQR
jgi:hypothetical protein